MPPFAIGYQAHDEPQKKPLGNVAAGKTSFLVPIPTPALPGSGYKGHLSAPIQERPFGIAWLFDYSILMTMVEELRILGASLMGCQSMEMTLQGSGLTPAGPFDSFATGWYCTIDGGMLQTAQKIEWRGEHIVLLTPRRGISSGVPWFLRMAE
jgi:hypothetical protein